jgi:hypothetical protein
MCRPPPRRLFENEILRSKKAKILTEGIHKRYFVTQRLGKIAIPEQPPSNAFEPL